MSGLNLSSIEQPSSKKHKKGTLDFLNQEISLFGNAWSAKKKEAFYSELAILMEAGIDIRSALDVILGEFKKGKKDHTLIAQIRETVISGKSLSEALKLSGKFSPYEVYSIQIGEETGKLSKILTELSSYFKKSINQKRQVINALSYPSLVLFASIGAIIFMMYFIVPMFADVFQRLGGELPAITLFVVNMSDWFLDNGTLLLLSILTIIGVLTWQKNQPWFRKGSSWLLIRLPLFGGMIRKIQLGRFATVMSLLISSKIPLLKALELVEKMIAFYPIQHSLEQIKKDILQGRALNESLADHHIYPSRMVSLIKVGEEVNQLDSFFEKIAQLYSEEVEHKTKVLGSLIEPIMLLVLGALVGTILIAMYLPMFKMGGLSG